jgi:hypothetical protein
MRFKMARGLDLDTRDSYDARNHRILACGVLTV